MRNTESHNREGSNPKEILVWDWPTRAFHWSLALTFLGSWITAEAGLEWASTHMFLGYMMLSLLLFRILWGFVGTRHAKFSSFLVSPRVFFSSLQNLFSRRSEDHIGHGPSGGWATVLIISVLLVQAISGLFISDDIFNDGPYHGSVSEGVASFMANMHHLNFNLILCLVALHLSAIGWFQFGKNQALTKAMLLGKTKGPAVLGIKSSQTLKALSIFSVCASIIWLIVWLAPEPVYLF